MLLFRSTCIRVVGRRIHRLFIHTSQVGWPDLIHYRPRSGYRIIIQELSWRSGSWSSYSSFIRSLIIHFHATVKVNNRRLGHFDWQEPRLVIRKGVVGGWSRGRKRRDSLDTDVLASQNLVMVVLAKNSLGCRGAPQVMNHKAYTRGAPESVYHKFFFS